MKKGHTFPAINTSTRNKIDESFGTGFSIARKNVGSPISYSGAPK